MGYATEHETRPVRPSTSITSLAALLPSSGHHCAVLVSFLAGSLLSDGPC